MFVFQHISNKYFKINVLHHMEIGREHREFNLNLNVSTLRKLMTNGGLPLTAILSSPFIQLSTTRTHYHVNREKLHLLVT